MQILWIKSEYPLPLDTGHRKRTYNLIKYIGDRARITFLSLSETRLPTLELKDEGLVQTEIKCPIRPETRSGPGFYLRLFGNLGGSLPYFVKCNAVSQVIKEQRRLYGEGKLDLILCDCLDMAAAIDFKLPVPKVLLTNGIATELWHQRYEAARGLIQRAYFNYETKRMAAFESTFCNRFDRILVASETDKLKLEEGYRVRVPIEIVPTGVDCAYFQPDQSTNPVRHRLVYTGSNDLLSNIDGLLWFAAQVYPAIKREFPDVSLEIIGPRPASEIRALAQKDKSINVTGWVDDIRPHLSSAELFVVPLRVPGGMRAKIFEAMCMKVPVVSTLHGAEGLGLTDGHHIRTATDAHEMARVIIELLSDAEQRSSQAEHGYRLVNRENNWTIVADRMVKALHRALE